MAEDVVEKILQKAKEATDAQTVAVTDLEKRRQSELENYGVDEESMKAENLKLLPWVLTVNQSGNPGDTFLTAIDAKGNILAIEKQKGDNLNVSQKVGVSIETKTERYIMINGTPNKVNNPKPDYYLTVGLKDNDGKSVVEDSRFLALLTDSSGTYNESFISGGESLGGFSIKEIRSLKDLDLPYNDSRARVGQILVTK